MSVPEPTFPVVTLRATPIRPFLGRYSAKELHETRSTTVAGVYLAAG
jgi:hypothetical protein